MNKFSLIFISSLMAGIITGIAFAASFFGKFDLHNLYEHHLEVAFVAITIGIILGVILSPLGYWCLKDKNLILILPLLYSLGFVVTLWLTLIGHNKGNNSLGFTGAFIYWILALLLSKFIAPKRKKKV